MLEPYSSARIVVLRTHNCSIHMFFASLLAAAAAATTVFVVVFFAHLFNGHPINPNAFGLYDANRLWMNALKPSIAT